MGGARLTDSGLHFGHYLGCLSHLHSLRYRNYVFVVRDNEFRYRFGQAETHFAFTDFAADVLAACPGAQIHVVRQTDLILASPRLRTFLTHLITANQLFNAHAERGALMDGKRTNLSVAQLEFPIDSVCSYVGLQSRFICMNDDNIRFVNFGAEVTRRLNNAVPSATFPIPELRTGMPSRILGPDYQKMAFARGNVLNFRDTDKGINSFVDRLFRKSAFFSAFPSEHSRFEASPKTYRFDQRFLPFSYLRAFDLVSAADLSAGMVMGDFNDRKRILLSAILNLFQSWREARSRIFPEIELRLADSQRKMLELAEPVEQLISSTGKVSN